MSKLLQTVLFTVILVGCDVGQPQYFNDAVIYEKLFTTCLRHINSPTSNQINACRDGALIGSRYHISERVNRNVVEK